MYSALDDSEEKIKKLEQEIENFKETLLSESEGVSKNLSSLTQRFEAHEHQRKKKQLQIFQQELQQKNEEINLLKQENFNLKNSKKTGISASELEKIVFIKDEQLKKLNRKFQKMVQKLDILGKEKEELENSNKSLETDRKKIAEKWQQ